MKTAIVKSSWLSSIGKRLDAEFHLSEAVKTRKLLKQAKVSLLPLSKVTNEIFLGNIFRRTFVGNSEKGIAYITASDMVNANINTGKYLSKKLTLKQDRLLLKKDWILLSCSGTLGNVVYTNENFKGRIGTHDLIRIVPNNNSKAIPGFLYAYLASKYGYSLLIQPSYGGVIKHIEPHHILDLPVPIFNETKQKEIHNLINKVSRLREDANVSILNAQEKFEKYSQINQLTNNTNIKRISNYQNRLDAQFGLIFQSIKEFIIAKDFTYLGEVTSSIFMGPRSKRNYVSKGVGFLNTSEMMLSNPSNPKKFVSNKTKGFEVHKDWILISRSGTIGNCVIVGDMLKNYFVTEDAIRIVCNKDLIHPNYVFAFLISSIGTKLIQSGAFGSVIQHIDEQLLASIPIPLLSKTEQSEVIDNVQKYRDNYDLAIQLENKAIQLIETEIESWQN
ncbi:MAG: restriction endonuclease subunit S [Breznakibacter sp.]